MLIANTSHINSPALHWAAQATARFENLEKMTVTECIAHSQIYPRNGYIRREQLNVSTQWRCVIIRRIGSTNGGQTWNYHGDSLFQYIPVFCPTIHAGRWQHSAAWHLQVNKSEKQNCVLNTTKYEWSLCHEPLKWIERNEKVKNCTKYYKIKNQIFALKTTIDRCFISFVSENCGI